ncbi:quinol monooxygenase YgiN [Saccharothrix ecbatanensis]|uniref:Quinol monooxygenase YgiN n=1 Tax=Saccharothrix ecbatanensis TaxID=1105145 RepID=A0A7W9LYR9_9PSEU|nr:antibiotic biosynthesis monooxygenase family protein [Saccharothrix ecbatanensis]MBB5800922.1 quinol monooxygenase YgiN [Saccharothrix ecbatanensis]
MSILVRVEVTVPEAQLDEFRELAEKLTTAIEDEPGTIRYRWFTGKDPSMFVLIEEFVDEDAALDHNRNCGALLEKIATVSTVTRNDVYGTLSDDIKRELESKQGKFTFAPLFD